MKLHSFVGNYFFVSPFLVNGLPKAGTNLLTKAVSLFPGIRSTSVHLSRATLANFKPSHPEQTTDMLPIGIDWPQNVSCEAVKQALNQLKKGSYATGHICYSDTLSELLTALGMKSVLILRDPRDVVVSHAFYVAKNPKHFLYEYYQELSNDDRITKSMVGVEQVSATDPLLLNIDERFRIVLPWISATHNYTTYFEKLVGGSGGGSRQNQIDELNNIAQHLGIYCNSSAIAQNADKLFGGTVTFRRGNIGGWRNHYSSKHKQIFKDVAGQLLIDLGYEQNFDW